MPMGRQELRQERAIKDIGHSAQNLMSSEELWQRVKGCSEDQVETRVGSGFRRITKEPIPCGSKLHVHKYGNGVVEFSVAFNKKGMAAFIIYDDMAIGHNVEAGSRTTHVFHPPPLGQQTQQM